MVETYKVNDQVVWQPLGTLPNGQPAKPLRATVIGEVIDGKVLRYKLHISGPLGPYHVLARPERLSKAAD